MQRSLELIAAIILLTLLFPFVCALAAVDVHYPIIVRRPRTGWQGKRIKLYEFAQWAGLGGGLLTWLRLHRYPTLINIVRGDLAFVGPRPARPHEFSSRTPAERRRLDVRPGMISPWWIRVRANIAYSSEPLVDASYVETRSLTNDVGIALRALPALVYGQGNGPLTAKVNLLGCSIDNFVMPQAIDAIIEHLAGEAPKRVVFVNAHCFNVAGRNQAYLRSIRTADLVLADGIGVKIAGAVLNRPIRQNVNGTDMFPHLCSALSGTGQRLYLLGGKPGIAERVRQWIETNHPGVVVCGHHDGFFADNSPSIARRIHKAKADLLLVAMGVPRQDEWLDSWLPLTGAKVGIGVGGLFDFYSGAIPRAPQWIREIGCEWIFRLVQEPRRMWKRYLVGNLVFLHTVLAERLRRSDSVVDGDQNGLMP